MELYFPVRSRDGGTGVVTVTGGCLGAAVKHRDPHYSTTKSPTRVDFLCNPINVFPP